MNFARRALCALVDVPIVGAVARLVFQGRDLVDVALLAVPQQLLGIVALDARRAHIVALDNAVSDNVAALEGRRVPPSPPAPRYPLLTTNPASV